MALPTWLLDIEDNDLRSRALDGLANYDKVRLHATAEHDETYRATIKRHRDGTAAASKLFSDTKRQLNAEKNAVLATAETKMQTAISAARERVNRVKVEAQRAARKAKGTQPAQAKQG